VPQMFGRPCLLLEKEHCTVRSNLQWPCTPGFCDCFPLLRLRSGFGGQSRSGAEAGGDRSAPKGPKKSSSGITSKSRITSRTRTMTMSSSRSRITIRSRTRRKSAVNSSRLARLQVTTTVFAHDLVVKPGLHSAQRPLSACGIQTASMGVVHKWTKCLAGVLKACRIMQNYATKPGDRIGSQVTTRTP
jgi:hypothetical protein